MPPLGCKCPSVIRWFQDLRPEQVVFVLITASDFDAEWMKVQPATQNLAAAGVTHTPDGVEPGSVSSFPIAAEWRVRLVAHGSLPPLSVLSHERLEFPAKRGAHHP